MFQNWNFLIAEMWVLLALAALVGLIAGFFFFGGKSKGEGNFSLDQSLAAAKSELLSLRKQLDAAQEQMFAQEAELSDLRQIAAASGVGLGTDGAGAGEDTLAELPEEMPEEFAQLMLQRDERIALLEADLEDLRAELETDASKIESRFEEMIAEADARELEIERLNELLATYEAATGTDDMPKQANG